MFYIDEPSRLIKRLYVMHRASALEVAHPLRSSELQLLGLLDQHQPVDTA